MTDGWVRAGRGIEDTVIIKIPGVSDVALRRIQRCRQSDINEVATLATLVLHAGRKSDGRRGESSSHWNCRHEDTNHRDSEDRDALSIYIVRFCLHARVSHKDTFSACSKSRLFGNAVVTFAKQSY